MFLGVNTGSLPPGVDGLDGAFFLNFLTGALDPRVTFTRSSSAYRTNAAGKLELMGNDTARFDYDPVTLARKGLLLEDVGTNICLRSSEFENAAWNTTTNTSVSTNSELGPDEGSLADTITATGANGVRKQGVTTTAVSHTFSVYLKRKTGTGNVDITLDGTTWVTQAVTAQWLRFSVTQTGVAGTSNPGIRLVTSGDEVYAFGAQVEVGAFASSYIATAGASASRSVESATVSGVDFTSWYNEVEGTMLAEFDLLAPALARGFNGGAWVLKKDLSDNIALIFSNSFGNAVGYMAAGGAQQVGAFTVATVPGGTPMKFASAFKVDDYAQSLNGAAVDTDSVLTMPTGLTSLHIGESDIGTPLSGHIRSLRYFRTRLSNATLQALTAGA
jgi:hypothetical protein